MKPSLKPGNILSVMLSAGSFCCCEASGEKIRRLLRRSFDPDGPASDSLRKTFDMDIPAGADISVSVALDTERMCLVPESLYEPSESVAYLQTAGIEPSSTEQIIATQPKGAIVAVMCAEQGICDYLESRFGQVAYVHPLQTIAPESDAPCIEAVLTPRLIHLSAWAGKLLFAAALPGRTEADLLYYLRHVEKLHPDTRFSIRLSGIGAEDVRPEVSRYFRNVALVRPFAPGGISKAEATAFSTIIRMCYANH